MNAGETRRFADLLLFQRALKLIIDIVVHQPQPVDDLQNEQVQLSVHCHCDGKQEAGPR